MRPFHPPRPGAAQPHHPRPGDPGQPPPHALPMHHQQMNPAAFAGFGAANPMAAVAAANPFLAMQLFGQAQQLQNLGYLAAAALQQHQHHHQQPQQQQNPFFPGGFPPNPSQFGAFPGPQAGFNAGGGGFRPGGAGLPGGPRPPLPMMGAAGNGANGGGIGVNGSPRPALNVDGKDRGSGGGVGQVNQTTNKSDGISHVASENGVRNNATDQKSRFNPGRDGKDGRKFGPSGGRGRGDSRGGGQFTPSGGRGRGDSRGGGQFSPSGGRGRGDARGGEQFSASGGRGRGRHFNQGRGRGRNDWREGKSNFTSSDSPTSGGCHVDSPASEGGRKRPPIIYDKNEVKQWIQARKKNYPTSVNVNKKLCQSQLDEQKKDEEAQMRRRELKEVIAKQKELGLELPELPPGYLSDNEGQPREAQKESNWKTRQGGGRFGNRGRGRGQGRGRGRDNKRQRYDSREDYPSKRLREWNNNSRQHDGDAMAKSREQTLLQKLLSSDIKRDRHRLLHTFKFMALNNFFKDWPAKPLEFPSVKVNQIELESDIAEEESDDDLPDAETAKGCSLGLKENGDQPDSSSSDEEDGSEDDDECDDKGADAEITEKVSDEDSECDASEEGFSDFSA